MITLKGISDSMLRCVIPEDLPSSGIVSSLDEVRIKGESMLRGAGLVLDFGSRSLSWEVVCRVLEDFVWPSRAEVKAWITYDAETQDLLKRAGLPTTEPRLSGKNEDYARTLRVDRSLRGGQRVEHNGDVIVCGHVNDGAEVLASGSVMVLGRLHGLVHAAKDGEDGATIAARSMEAPQVRIGTRLGSLGRDPIWWGKSVIIRVEDGVVLIDFWPAMKHEEARTRRASSLNGGANGQ